MILSGDSMHPKRPRPSVSVWNNSKGPSQFPRPEWDLLRLLLQLHHDLPSPFVILLSLKVKVTQSCLILCNPMNCSPSGSSVHGILQATMLEGWGGECSGRGYRMEGTNVRLRPIHIDVLQTPSLYCRVIILQVR